MQLPATKIARQIICLGTMPLNEWNDDPKAERVQRVDDSGRPLYRTEVLLLPAGEGRPLQCWVRSAYGENAPHEGSSLQAENLVLELYVDRRDGKARWSMSADTLSALA